MCVYVLACVCVSVCVCLLNLCLFISPAPECWVLNAECWELNAPQWKDYLNVTVPGISGLGNEDARTTNLRGEPGDRERQRRMYLKNRKMLLDYPQDYLNAFTVTLWSFSHFWLSSFIKDVFSPPKLSAAQMAWSFRLLSFPLLTVIIWRRINRLLTDS